MNVKQIISVAGDARADFTLQQLGASNAKLRNHIDQAPRKMAAQTK